VQRRARAALLLLGRRALAAQAGGADPGLGHPDRLRDAAVLLGQPALDVVDRVDAAHVAVLRPDRHRAHELLGQRLDELADAGRVRPALGQARQLAQHHLLIAGGRVERALQGLRDLRVALRRDGRRRGAAARALR
jgi:hypothetical protein